MAKIFANSNDPDQTPCSAASDLGLHCLPTTLLGVSQLQGDKEVLVYVFSGALKCPGGWVFTAPDFISQGPGFESH